MGEMADYYRDMEEVHWPPGVRDRARQSTPHAHGRPWTKNDDADLARMLKRQMTYETIANVMGRTTLAIQYREQYLITENAARNLAPAKTYTTKEKDVNLTHLLTLLQDNYTTVKVVFKDGGSPYTYKIQKSVAVKPMDRVVVYAEDQLKIATVFTVDDEPDVDLSAPYALKWVVQVVDLTYYDEQVQHEAAALQHLKKLNNAKKRDELLKTLFGGSEGLEEVKALLKGPN